VAAGALLQTSTEKQVDPRGPRLYPLRGSGAMSPGRGLPLHGAGKKKGKESRAVKV